MNEQQLQVKLGTRIKKLRMKKDMTQNQLALQCKFQRSGISRIESGQRNLTVNNLYKISRALDVPVLELFKD
jgi:transcriptional regulator with XRE-family HTH domain